MRANASDRLPARAPLRILIAGEWHSDIHETAWRRGLEALGHEVVALPWHTRFRSRRKLGDIAGRVQNRLIAGPAVWAFNARLVEEAWRRAPDAVILYRPTHILPSALRLVRCVSPATVIATYNNDDPFSPRASRLLWRNYFANVRAADVNMVYREKNVRDLKRLGARGVAMIRSAYLPEVHRPIELTAAERARLGADVVFVGHYEPDGRLPYLRAIAESGVDFKLFGPDWERAPREPWLARFQPIAPARGEDYVRAIAGAKIAICLLSGLNNDTYTRRCFEIPAIGTMLLCQRTEDMRSLFREGEEADYFGTPEELVAKIRHYLADDDARLHVAAAGRRRVAAAGHDIYSRMREVERLLMRDEASTATILRHASP